jgi:tetratricopeptide (TPR) repeat protein
MLAGRLPFNAAGANEWKEAHLHGQIESTSHNREGAGLLLAELALECLSKDADARPHSFAQILDKLIPIGLDAEPAVMELLIASDVFELDNLGLTRSILLPSLISDLLTLEQPVQALEELSTVSPEALSPELMLQKGTALALVGHEEQAIETFNQVLKNELTEEQRFRCLNELGLSLKHQHRYQEAEDIFKDLLNDVPEPDLSRTVVNLASVYLEVGNPQAAVSILKRHLVKHVNEASAWTSLGVAQRACADYPSAAQSFRQAIRLNHNQSLAYFQLASLNMDYADRLNPVEALATLEAAYQQGLDHPQLIPRLLTCYVVLEEVDKARQLIPKLKSDFEGELIDLIAQELSMYSPADHGAHERLLRYLVALYRVKLEEIP